MLHTRSSALGSRTTTPVPLSSFQVGAFPRNTPGRTKSRTRPSSAPFSRSARSANLQGADPSTHSEDGHPFDQRSNVDGTRQAPSQERGTRNSKPQQARPRPTSSTPPMTPRRTAVRRREQGRGNLLPPWEDGSSAGGSRESADFDLRNRRFHPPISGAEDRRSRAKELVLGKMGEGSRTQQGMVETSAETKRGVAVVGSPYMSRAERSKEVVKESARMRKEINALRAEVTASRNEAIAAHKRFEDLEGHVEAVLRDTAEMLPQYRYGLDLSEDVKKTSSKSRLIVLEHRKELEKTVIVRRLREEVSRLVRQLADKEDELSLLQRSCQFTALTEMHAAGEEYVKEVERLRAKLNSNGQSHGGCNFQHNAHHDGVDTTAVVRPSNTQLVKADDEPNSGSEFIEQQSCDGNHFTHQTRLRAHNNDGERFNSASPKRHIDKGEGQEWPEHATRRVSHSANSHRRHTRHREEHANGSRSNGTYEGRRVGKASVPRRFQPSRLSQRGISIDQPIRKGNVSPHENRRADWPKTGERINLNPRAELDVMTGLVLAQQQRIERQRAKMLELERDLRDYRRAVAVGGEWPKESWPLPASLNRPRRRAGPNAGLTPSRSAPAGLGLCGEKRRGRATTSSAVARHPNNDEPCRRKMKKTGQEQIYKPKWRSRANLSKCTNGVADAREAQLPLSSCKGDGLRADASGSPSLRRKSYPRGYSPGQSEEAVEGFHDGGGGFKVGEDALPEGWGQAIDERTGHVYYFCDGRSTWVRPTISPEVRDEHEKLGGAATNTSNPAGSEPSTALIATANGLADSLLAATQSTEEKSPRDREFRDLEGVFERDRAAVVSDLWKDRLRERKSESTPGQGDNQPVGIPLAMIRSLSNSTTIDTPNEGGLQCMGDRSSSNPDNRGSLANETRRRQIEASDTDSSR